MDKELKSKLDSIILLLQYLFILESTKGGLSREEIRKILKIDNARVSAIGKCVKDNEEVKLLKIIEKQLRGCVK